jgi:hypothetical protein
MRNAQNIVIKTAKRSLRMPNFLQVDRKETGETVWDGFISLVVRPTGHGTELSIAHAHLTRGKVYRTRYRT